jgi:hypothetical protein
VGSSQSFIAFGTGLPQGCFATQANLGNVTWSVSDSPVVSITVNQGRATVSCVSETAVPITVTSNLAGSDNGGVSAVGTGTITCF